MICYDVKCRWLLFCQHHCTVHGPSLGNFSFPHLPLAGFSNQFRNLWSLASITKSIPSSRHLCLACFLLLFLCWIIYHRWVPQLFQWNMRLPCLPQFLLLPPVGLPACILRIQLSSVIYLLSDFIWKVLLPLGGLFSQLFLFLWDCIPYIPFEFCLHFLLINLFCLHLLLSLVFPTVHVAPSLDTALLPWAVLVSCLILPSSVQDFLLPILHIYQYAPA